MREGHAAPAAAVVDAAVLGERRPAPTARRPCRRPGRRRHLPRAASATSRAPRRTPRRVEIRDAERHEAESLLHVSMMPGRDVAARGRRERAVGGLERLGEVASADPDPAPAEALDDAAGGSARSGPRRRAAGRRARDPRCATRAAATGSQPAPAQEERRVAVDRVRDRRTRARRRACTPRDRSRSGHVQLGRMLARRGHERLALLRLEQWARWTDCAGALDARLERRAGRAPRGPRPPRRVAGMGAASSDTA